MIKLFFFVGFIMITGNSFAQDTTLFLKRYDQQMLHFNKNGYKKNGYYFDFKSLKNEMKPGLPSYYFYEQYRVHTKKATYARSITLIALIPYIVSINIFNHGAGEILFYASSLTMLVSSIVGLSHTVKARNYLQQTFKSRNREILAGYSP